MKLDDKVIVVTGAGSGMGRELALALLGRGARVAAVDLRAESLEQTAALAAAGQRLSVHVLDVTDRAAVEALPDQVIAAHGTVDGVINNAGIIQPFVTFEELDHAAELHLHHPVDFHIQRTLRREELSRVEKLRVELYRGPDSLPEETIAEMRLRRDHDLEHLDDGVRRMVNPHVYHVSLTRKLWELKQQLVRERSFPATARNSP